MFARPEGHIKILVAKSFTAFLALVLLVACGSDNLYEPKELEKIIPSVTVSKLWDRSIGDGDDELMLSLTPVIEGDYIYSIDVQGELYVTERNTGKVFWERSLDERVSAGLGSDALRLYYATFQGEIVCLDIETGDELWRAKLTSEAISPPSSNGSLVAVQAIDGKLYAFDTLSGTQKWRYASIDPLLSLRGTPSPFVNEELTISSFSNGEMIAIDNTTGYVRWKAVLGTAQGRTELERLVDPDGNPVFYDGKIYGVAYQGELAALDLTTGQTYWSKEVSSFNGLTIAADKIFVTTDEGVVVAFSERSPEELWRNEKLKYRRLSSPVAYKNYILMADFEGYVHVISQITGEISARFRPDSDGVMGLMKVVDGVICINTHSGELFAYEIIE